MIIVYGFRTMFRREGLVGTAVCDNCGHRAQRTLCRYIKQFTLYRIPIISYTKKRGIMCESCGYILPLRGSEYSSMKNRHKLQS